MNDPIYVYGTTHLTFETITGSSYEIKGGYVRRQTNDMSGVMRRDDNWVKLLHLPVLSVGHSTTLYLEALFTSLEGEGFTMRSTSQVMSITVLEP